MKLIHNIGKSPKPDDLTVSSNYNIIDDILSNKSDISFDGVYLNVYTGIMNHKKEFKKFLEDYNIYLFIIGLVIGKDNLFDTDMPYEKYADINQIEELRELGCILGWHTWEHKDLTTLSERKMEEELIAPRMFKDFFAYPYGKFDDKVLKAVKRLNYKKAWSVNQGDDSKFQLNREYI